MRACEVRERHAGHALHDHGEQEEVGVGVGVAGAGGEVELALVDDERERLGIGGDLLEAVAREGEEAVVVAETARVAHEMVDRERRAVVGELGNVFPHLVTERQFVLLGQEQGARGGKLLGGRADVEERGRGDAGGALEVGHAVAATVGDATVLEHAECTSGECGES